MNNTRFPRVRASTKAAHEIYHNNTYLMTKDIKELFDCSPSTAGKIKKDRQELQGANEV